MFYYSGLSIQLVGGNSLRGRVEITRDGSVGTICDTDWDDYDAGIVCRQLGFAAGSAVLGSYFGKSTGAESVLDHVDCYRYMSQPSIYGCLNSGWKNNISCGDQHIAGVRCYTNGNIACVAIGSTDG